MATIRRKNGKWQALIRRAGAPTCSKTFISKSDARKWAIRAEQTQDKAIAGVVDKQALNTPLRAYLSRYKTDIPAFKASSRFFCSTTSSGNKPDFTISDMRKVCL